MSVLSVENVSFGYTSVLSFFRKKNRADKHPVLSNINIEIEQGQIVALVGQSGSGKSTLLHLIGGYLTPDEGKISVGGTRVSGPSSQCTMMFQDDFLYPWLTVEKNIALGLRVTKHQQDISERVNHFIDIVGLREHRHKLPSELSGGQRQRVAFCRGLTTNPDVVLLDEPFSALDPMTRERLQTVMRNTIQDSGKSLIFVSHSIEEVICMADVVYAISEGKILERMNIDLSNKERQDTSSRYPYELHLSHLLKKGEHNEDMPMLYTI